jgi:anti-anti-sigma factor
MAAALINTRRSADGSVVVEVRGEIDFETSGRLRDILVDAASRLMPIRVVVDLLHVTFIDSTGIGALAAGRNAAHRVGIDFSLRHPGPFVTERLRQIGLYDTLVGDA